MRIKTIVMSAAGLLLAGQVLAVDLPGPVVDTAWLAAHLKEVQVVSVQSDPSLFTAKPYWEKDAKSGKAMLIEAAGHVPGARLVNAKTIRVARTIGAHTVKYMVPEGAEFEAMMRQAGLTADRPIVLVPLGQQTADMDDAARLYWQLKYYGDDRVAILNGGMAAWIHAGGELSTAAAPAQTGDWTAAAPRADLVATSDEVAAGKAQVVDARSLPQYHGLSKRDYVFDYGHIPGAHALPPDVQVMSAGGTATFLPAASYRTILKASGIDPDAPAITYCNSGHLAAGAWFVMSQIVGNPAVKLYDGSLHEWTLEKRPMEGIAQR
ncbi:sulfurtransferase [Nitrogeniibacter mangrovi]|uniref:Sulfurtransferase n=1 Tax=Nitrogeniibacter mangrovi TaxID=2016596 RepID=A0A6C1BA13_9RHOO|nr:rhodanese-like domain-containing protein [Nitrogeniibacter mangrovi]QID19528.1 sulfurtransferase [Nitrogeniibacter mangrovi]